MSFGLRDNDWVDPDEEPDYDGRCDECMRYTACPCGCGWGYCDDSDGEMFEGDCKGCKTGVYVNPPERRERGDDRLDIAPA